MDTLPLVLVDRVCLFLIDIRDASALQKTCNRLRGAGLGPECKWHWRLNKKQSSYLVGSSLRDSILNPKTAIHTLDFSHKYVTVLPPLANVHTVHVMTVSDIRDELRSSIVVAGTDWVLVSPGTRLGRILKLNQRVFGISGNLEVIDEEKCPLYGVSRRNVLEMLRAMRAMGPTEWP